LQDWKLTDEVAVMDIGELNNDGLEIGRLDNDARHFGSLQIRRSKLKVNIDYSED